MPVTIWSCCWGKKKVRKIIFLQKKRKIFLSSSSHLVKHVFLVPRRPIKRPDFDRIIIGAQRKPRAVRAPRVARDALGQVVHIRVLGRRTRRCSALRRWRCASA
jgi:hypothetical protein